jgi:YidC/Oxa1 family membrane protein insertase
VIFAHVLTPLEDLLRNILEWLGPHGAIGLTWAWSIVALTVMVRLVLVPLTVRQIHSMQSLQRHAPEMKEIQKKYKADKKRQQEELMKFYRENNINPAASCLPLLAQFPVFIALYLVLKHFPHAARGQPGLARPLEHHRQGVQGWGPVLVAVYAMQPARLELLHERDGRPRAADHAAGPPDRLHPVHHQLQARPRPLLDDDEPLDGRPGPDHAPLMPRPQAPEKRSSRTPPKEVPHRLPRSRPSRRRRPSSSPSGSSSRAA